MRRPNLRSIGIDESEDLQLKGPANIFNKIMEENFPNLKHPGNPGHNDKTKPKDYRYR